MLSVSQSLFPKHEAAGFQLYFTSHSTCCLNFWWRLILSAAPVMSLQFLSAALPNLLLFFIFIVSVVSLLSCKLIRRGLMLELAPYADSKPLSANKVYHVRLSLILWIFIYLAWGGKQREMDGIMVISFCVFFLFRIYLETMGNLWKVYLLFVYY